MHRRDQIDSALAKHFAWTFARPGDTAALAERLRAVEAAASQRPPPLPAAPARPNPDERTAERTRSKARANCRSLAAAVAEAWASLEGAAGRAPGERIRTTGAGPAPGDAAEATVPPAGLAVVKRLLARADRLGVELLEMAEWPAEAVRFLRLLVRFGAKMTRRQRERCASIATLLPLDHPEAADLFVEIARAGDRLVADALLADDEWAPEVGSGGALVARLADVLDDGPANASRVIAIDLLQRLEHRAAAVPALKRALKRPSFAVRAHALSVLTTFEPCAVAPDELVQLLRDLVAHAVPDALSSEEHEEDERIFAQAVLSAVEHAPSDEAAEALLDWIDAEHDTLWLDAGWATEALAVAFPETAAAMVDHWLKCARAYDRARALAALERLPPDLATPRLRLAANDPSPGVRESAREQWLQRFGSACPEDPSGLIGAPLLQGPTGDRFASRLAVLNGRVPEARQAMARALLAEAPDREALVLLLQFVGDDTLSKEPVAHYHERPGDDPEGERARPPAEPGRRGATDWASVLVRRFGPLGVEGLCLLAARFPEPESFGWTRRLGDLVARGVIALEDAGATRALAARHIASDDHGAIDDSLRLLALVGAPPELLDRALRFALDADQASSAAHDLIVGWPDRAVDARLASRMALAVAERDWVRVQRAASLALGRGSHGARVIAQRVLEIAEEDEAAVDAAVECAHRLRSLGLLGDDWALSALARTDSPLFTVAARVWRKSAAVRPALEAALTSSARRGASRAEAAIALLWGEPPLSPRDRRLSPVLVAAPPRERAELVHAMCIHGAPLSQLASHLQELLASPDVEVTQALVGVAHWLRSSKGQALLRAALPRVVDPDLRADIEEELGTTETPYWVEG